MYIDSENVVNFLLSCINEVGGHLMRSADVVDFERHMARGLAWEQA
jgi:hypothetical protein